MKKFYTEYHGIWYKFMPERNVWRLGDAEYEATAHIADYPADVYRIDQCIEAFKQFLQENKNKYRY